MDALQSTLPQLLAERVRASPQATAFTLDGADGRRVELTWAAFDAQVAATAQRLRGAGLARGDRLAIVGSVSLEWELVQHAALRCGIAVVGIDPHELPARMASLMRRAGVHALAGDAPQALRALVGADGEAPPDAVRCVLWWGDAVAARPPGLAWIGLGDSGTSGGDAGSDAGSDASADTSASADAGGNAGAEIEAHPARPDDLAVVIFTSGTTGEPKMLGYTHGQVCLAVEAIREVFPFVGPGSRLLCWLPLANLFQRIVNLAGMTSGASSHLLRDPKQVMSALARVSPDVFIGVPRVYEKLLQGIQAQVAALPPLRRALVRWAWGVGRRSSPWRQRREPPPWPLSWTWLLADRWVLARVRAPFGTRLRCMVSGSAPLPRHVLEELFALGLLVLEAYGLSENVVPMAMNRLDDFRFGTVGKPLHQHRVALLPSGELTVSGAGVCRPVWGGQSGQPVPDIGAEAALNTGDIGEFDSEGNLTLIGRKSDFIKTSTGRRIAPAGVEAAFSRVTGLEQAVLLGESAAYLTLLCTYTPASVRAEDKGQIEQQLRTTVAALPEPERPAGILMLSRPLSVETGELTSNLKLRRTAIAEIHAQALHSLNSEIHRFGSRRASDPVLMWL